MSTEAGNEAIKNGTIASLMRETEHRWHPEGMYFTTIDGHRTAIMVFDLPDASAMPRFAEPFFDKLGANVELDPVMNIEDLQKGLAQLN